MPADQEHRFGHGKIEALAALGQGLFILASALYLLFESFHRFIHPQAVRDAGVGIGVMVLSIALTGVLIGIQHYVIKKAGSVALSADYLERKGDLLVNTGVLLALALGTFIPWPYFDPLFAFGISLIFVGKKYVEVLRKEVTTEKTSRSPPIQEPAVSSTPMYICFRELPVPL